MSAVLSPGASQLGLTTTVLPQIRLHTTLPFLHQHAGLHKKLLEQRKFDQLPQNDEMQDRPRTRKQKRRRRTKRQHGMEGARLLVKSGGGSGYNLRIHKNGTIDGEPMSNELSIWCLLQIMVTLTKGYKSDSSTSYDRKVYIRGSESKLYVCMNSSGMLYARAHLNSTDDCEFYQDNKSGNRYYFISAAHGYHSRQRHKSKKRYRKEWLLGLDKEGKPRLGYKTSRSQMFGAFLIYPPTRNRPTRRPSPFSADMLPLPFKPRGQRTTQTPTTSLPPVRHHRRRCKDLPTKRRRRRCRKRRRERKARRHGRYTPPPPTTTSTPPPTTMRPTTTPVLTTTPPPVPTQWDTDFRGESTSAPNSAESRDFTPTYLTTQRPSTPPKFDDLVQFLSHFGEQSTDQHVQRHLELSEIVNIIQSLPSLQASNARTKSVSRTRRRVHSNDLLDRVLTRQKEHKHSSR